VSEKIPLVGGSNSGHLVSVRGQTLLIPAKMRMPTKGATVEANPGITYDEYKLLGEQGQQRYEYVGTTDSV